MCSLCHPALSHILGSLLNAPKHLLGSQIAFLCATLVLESLYCCSFSQPVRVLAVSGAL